MQNIKIIGIGSPFGLDQVGEIIIEHLQKILPQKEQIEIMYLDRPGFYLLEKIRDANIVHLIDAIRSNKAIGFIHRYEYPHIDLVRKHLLSSHEWDLEKILQLASTLGYLPKQFIIHGIEIGQSANISLNDPTINLAYKQLIQNLRNELGKIL